MPASIFQMLRGGILIITMTFRCVMLKKYPKNYEILGMGFATLGLFVVGLSSQITASEKPSSLGITLLVSSLLISGFSLVYQEWMLNRYNCTPIEILSWEGLWGMLLMAIILPCVEWIPCNFNGADRVCSQDQNGKLWVENTFLAFKQMFTALPLLIFYCMQSVTIAIYNYLGLIIVKQASSAARTMICSSRSICIWLFFITIPINGKREQFKSLQLSGFVILLIGQLIFYQLITVNLFRFNDHYKKSVSTTPLITETLSINKVCENNHQI